MMEDEPAVSRKVFGIGLSKTGTTSLTKALQILGLNVVHFPEVKNLFEIIENSDGATDTPVALHYKTLDNNYPDAKFILTIRDIESWIVSAEKFFQDNPPANADIEQLRIDIYSSSCWDEKQYATAYLQYNRDVQTYFSDRPDKLLLNDIIAGEGWEPLCKYLECAVPVTPFPHLNKAKVRQAENDVTIPAPALVIDGINENKPVDEICTDWKS